jgi:hypothetical protein
VTTTTSEEKQKKRDAVEHLRRKLLDKQTKNRRTCGRNELVGADDGCIETLGLDFFRFLVIERGFVDYQVLHYIHYTSRLWLSDFVTPKLQRRHELRTVGGGVGGGGGGNELERNVLKLTLNGFFGFGAVEAVHFSTTRLALESTLARKAKRLGLYSEKLLSMSLLGVVDRKDKVPELLYSATFSQPNARITNQIQLSVGVLSNSKAIFFGKILTILRVTDPRKCEISYAGERKKNQRTCSRSCANVVLFSRVTRYRFLSHYRL